MAIFGYDSYANELNLMFKCAQCGKTVETPEFKIPLPDFESESSARSDVSIDYDYECSCCGKHYDITLCSRTGGGDGTIDPLEDDAIVEVQDFPDYDDKYYACLLEHEERLNIIKTFEEHIKDIREILKKIQGLGIEDKAYPMLYVQVIASMEAYLSDTLISNVLKSDENKRKFVENFQGFKDMKISYQKIFSHLDKMEKFLSGELRKLMYHDLPKILGIYKCVLEVDFGDISDLAKAVRNRHDIVHRCGKTVDNKILQINKNDVEELLKKVDDFIHRIEKQINPLPSFDELLTKTELSPYFETLEQTD